MINMAIIHDSQLEIITSHLDIYISWRQPNGEFITESYIDEGMKIDEAIEKFKLKHEG
jgi:hypothetical protein